MNKKVVFLGTGGTIAGQAESASDNVGYKAAQVGIGNLLGSVPGLLRALGPLAAESEQVLQLNSKDMTFPDWLRLAGRLAHHLGRDDVTGVVVTHGTDTLEETAYFLHRLLPFLPSPNKPVVLTCAMRPASSAHADGPGNLADATAVVMSPHASGVLVVCAGKVHSGLHVQKVHPYRLEAFDSGEAGPLGYVEEGVVRFISRLEPAQASPLVLPKLQSAPCPRVEIVTSHSGATGGLVLDMLAAQRSARSRLAGIVVAGTGNGSVHIELEAALLEAVQQGVWVWRSSRCAYGQVVEATTGSEERFLSVGLSPAKARIEMVLQLLMQS